mmetsp:Transcript_16019/g.21568  ORF Transcript_16019/g.21568 Transcript_16019/m.21568 type:complete len:238 (+) Transcript_16019:245-958(+)
MKIHHRATAYDSFADNSHKPASFFSKTLTGPKETRAVVKAPVRAMEMAAKGKACGSEAARAAVPRPWAEAPIVNPLVTGDSTFSISNSRDPMLAPSRPVTTTMATANDLSAPIISATDIARGDVICREIVGSRKASLSPIKRAITAVTPSPRTEALITVAATWFRFCLTSSRFLNIGSAKEMTDGPSRNKSTSPPPGMEPAAPFVAYCWSNDVIDMPVPTAIPFSAKRAPRVHDMRG